MRAIARTCAVPILAFLAACAIAFAWAFMAVGDLLAGKD